MIDATFRLIHFTKPNLFVGLAWNYDEGVMITTTPCTSYTQARDALELLAEVRANLRWFDGEYTCAGEGAQIFAKED